MPGHKIIIDPYEHNIHHHYGFKNYNFALYFTWWDVLMGTHKEWMPAWEKEKAAAAAWCSLAAPSIPPPNPRLCHTSPDRHRSLDSAIRVRTTNSSCTMFPGFDRYLHSRMLLGAMFAGVEARPYMMPAGVHSLTGATMNYATTLKADPTKGRKPPSYVITKHVPLATLLKETWLECFVCFPKMVQYAVWGVPSALSAAAAKKEKER
jgi:hypothetical protein